MAWVLEASLSSADEGPCMTSPASNESEIASGASVVMGTVLTSSAITGVTGNGGAEGLPETADLLQRLQAAEARAVRAGRACSEIATRKAAKCNEEEELRMKLEAKSDVFKFLSERLLATSMQLEQEDRHVMELETDLASMLSIVAEVAGSWSSEMSPPVAEAPGTQCDHQLLARARAIKIDLCNAWPSHGEPGPSIRKIEACTTNASALLGAGGLATGGTPMHCPSMEDFFFEAVTSQSPVRTDAFPSEINVQPLLSRIATDVVPSLDDVVADSVVASASSCPIFEAGPTPGEGASDSVVGPPAVRLVAEPTLSLADISAESVVAAPALGDLAPDSVGVPSTPKPITGPAPSLEDAAADSMVASRAWREVADVALTPGKVASDSVVALVPAGPIVDTAHLSEEVASDFATMLPVPIREAEKIEPFPNGPTVINDLGIRVRVTSCDDCGESDDEPRGAPVTLHIYDVSGDDSIKFINDFARPAGTGAFHAGVEVHGWEYSFGSTAEGTGVSRCEPKGNKQHAYRESVFMGQTPLSAAEISRLVASLSVEWTGSDYNLLSRNCCHFSDGFCRALRVGPTPEWVRNLAGAGAAIVNGVQTVFSRAETVGSRLEYAFDQAQQPISVEDVEASVQNFWSKAVEGVGQVGAFAEKALNQAHRPLSASLSDTQRAHPPSVPRGLSRDPQLPAPIEVEAPCPTGSLCVQLGLAQQESLPVSEQQDPLSADVEVF